jgi:hypothetical protein
MESNMGRFKAQLPLPSTSEFEISFDEFSADEFDVSIDCFFPSDIPIPDAKICALVTGKFARIFAGSSIAIRIVNCSVSYLFDFSYTLACLMSE